MLVAYAFARFEFWGKRWLFAVMVGTMMLPLIVLRLPQYLMFRELGMLDTYWPLILPSAFATDTFFVFMLVQFLRAIPRDMEEAAMIDGCNALQMLLHIIVPLLKPGDRLGHRVPVHLDDERLHGPARSSSPRSRSTRCRSRSR